MTMPITCAVRFVMRSGPLRIIALIRERKETRSCRQRGRRMTGGGTERDLTPPHGCTVAEASSRTGVESAFALELPPAAAGESRRTWRANVPTLATKNAGNDLVEARGLAQAEQQRGAALVNGRTEIRVKAALQRARTQGKRLGRPRKVRLNGRHSWRFGAPSGAGVGRIEV